MGITACPKCGSPQIYQGTIGDGVLSGYFSKDVCRNCGYQGSSLLFDSEEDYKKFLKGKYYDDEKINIFLKDIKKTKGKKTNWKLISICFVFLIIIAAIITIGVYQTQTNQINNNNNNPIAIINTTMGTIKVDLYQNFTPITVNNFIDLSNNGFYENLFFHRVIDDFVIQGGGYDKSGNLHKSPYDNIIFETHQDARHVNGAIAMARSQDLNSASTQFYICDGPQSFLDDQYAVFGRVFEGMNVVRNIASVETNTKYNLDDWPVEDIIIHNIIIEDR